MFLPCIEQARYKIIWSDLCRNYKAHGVLRQDLSTTRIIPIATMGICFNYSLPFLIYDVITCQVSLVWNFQSRYIHNGSDMGDHKVARQKKERMLQFVT